MTSRVLCFGDSNTYGYNPLDGTRYKENERWSGILKQKLKQNPKHDFKIVEAGCNNRTCFSENPNGEELTGSKIISKYLTNKTDILILALGINDLQFQYNVTIDGSKNDVKNGLENIIELAYKINNKLNIILLCPTVITNDILFHGYFRCLFDESSIEKSKKMSKIYYDIAKKYGCFFVDLNEFASVSKTDGLHYDISEHKKIAQRIYELLKTLN